MADVHSKETRSYNMSHIKGKNTKPEMLVRHSLHTNGYRFIAKQSVAGGNPQRKKIYLYQLHLHPEILFNYPKK